jgi:hypothetical protein
LTGYDKSLIFANYVIALQLLGVRARLYIEKVFSVIVNFNILLMFVRHSILAAISVIAAGFLPSLMAQGSFTPAEYREALWMTTRMYGGQRSGEGPNWLTVGHKVDPQTPELASKGLVESKLQVGKCFTDDADGNYSLAGGWVDCGDHVKFGQTMFYAAYMLSFAYSEFPTGFDDLYSWDYEGYIASNDFSISGGKPNGIPDLLDELKYQTDFLIRCARNATTFYSQVGDGGPDHKNWVTSVAMAALSNSEGGQADGPRLIVKNPNDCAMPALAAAALANMSRLYRKYDADYAALCLIHAEYARAYAESKKGSTVGAAPFYSAKPDWADNFAIMYAELYRATNNNTYRTEALKYAPNPDGTSASDKIRNHNWTLCYNNIDDVAAYLLAGLGSADSKALLETLVAGYIRDAGLDKVFRRGPTWGILRYTASQAFSAALLSKLNGETTVNEYTKATIDFIMGKNTGNLSYIVGFGQKHVQRPHHRNYYLNDDITQDKDKFPVPEKNRFHGYMLGGNLNPANFNDVTTDYESTEGGIDYNAGLVASLAYIASIIAPIDTAMFGKPTPVLGPELTLCGTGSATITATVNLSNLKPGESVTYKWYKGAATTPFEQGDTKTSVTVTTADTYRCDLVEKSGAWTTSGSVVVSASLPAVSLGDDVELCEITSKILDAGITGTGISYAWKKDAATIAGATGRTYTAYTAGTYSVTVSAAGCTSKTDEVKITSLLPVVNHDTICAAGAASLSVATPGTYNWYDVPTAGTILSDANTYSPTISASKTYYVQDASSIAGSVGPNPATYTGGGNGNANGEIEMRFEAVGNYAITNLYIPYILYNAGESAKKASFEIVDDATGAVVSTQATVTGALVSGSYSAQGAYLIKFAVNLQVTGGTVASPKVLRLRFATTTPANDNNVYVYQDGSGPLAFPYGSGPLKIIGTRANGNLTTNKYAHFVKIDYLAGSSCARTPVLAVIDANNPNCGSANTVTQNISLQQGWNFIGIGTALADYSLQAVFGAAFADIAFVKSAEGFYSKSQPAYLNSLAELKLGAGYFVYSNKAAQISITGEKPGTVNLPLQQGWNAICHLGDNAPISNALSPNVRHFLEAAKDMDYFYIRLGQSNSLIELVKGNAYMLKLDGPTVQSY